MIPPYDPGILPQATATPAVIDLTQHPGAVITTYGDIGFIVLLVGAACLLGGWYLGLKRNYNGEVEA